jgi:hypothetical protein
MSNPFGKTVDTENPYATYVNSDGWEWLVLKTYQMPCNEDHESRWFVAVKSPFTFGRWEIGDEYASNILLNASLLRGESTYEWIKEYYDNEPF